MADIGKIVIEIDANDNGFQAKITGAKSAVENFGNSAQTHLTKTSGNLDKVAETAEKVKQKMELLGTVLLGAGFAEVAHKALDLSDSISDLSRGTDVSIPKILQLRAAFEANGGSAEGLGKALSKLSNYLQEARDGSAAAQETLLRLGISFRNMANMDTQEAMTAVIDKLAKMDDAIERNALAVRVFGRDAKNIDWAGIKEGTSSSTEEYAKYAEAIRKAGEAHDKLAETANNLLIAFTHILDEVGILDFINGLSRDMAKLEKIAIAATAAFAIMFGSSVIAAVINLAKAFSTLETGILAVFAAEKLLENGTVLGRLASLALTVGAAAGSFLGINAALDAYLERQKKVEDAKMPAFDMGKGEGWDNAKPVKAVNPAWAAEIKALDQISGAYEQVTLKELAKYQQGTKLIGLSDEQIDRATRLADITTKYNDELNKLADQEERLRAGQNSGNAAQTGAKLAQLQKEREEITQIYNTSFDQAVVDIQSREKANAAQREYLNILDEEASLRQRVADLSEKTAQLGLGPIAKQYAEIEAAARRAAQAEIETENKRRGTELGPMSAEAEKVYFDRADKVAEREKAALKSFLDDAQTFENGWKEAFEAYYENATIAANRGAQAFGAVMGRFDSLLDNFVRTGKLNFRDFATGILQDLMKIQLKAAAMNLFKVSGLGSMFGFADGGEPPVGQASLVGEKGPELFVPKSAGTIIPNNQLTGGGGTTNNTYITNNISAIDAKGVAQLFYENRVTLFGTMMKTQKEMPTRMQMQGLV